MLATIPNVCLHVFLQVNEYVPDCTAVIVLFATVLLDEHFSHTLRTVNVKSEVVIYCALIVSMFDCRLQVHTWIAELHSNRRTLMAL